ncbi:hypothetical protein AURDEDRAFT_116673 [Auricularia subglabra TFB-10046 SS5]|nr:hypothetical protein AURDEDRAFT_116673 [Auricularia subglabra TFB-10046 SS5]
MFRVEEAAAEPTRGAPVLSLVFQAHQQAQQASLLSMTMHDRIARRPAYVTTTHGARTTLWRVVAAGAGTLAPVASVVWAPPSGGGGGSARAFPAVERSGSLTRVEDVLVNKAGTIFGRSPAKHFVAGPHALACRWKVHDFGLGQRRLSAITAAANPGPTTPPVLLAEFFPPSAGVLKPSLTLFSTEAGEAADDIVFTALLATVGRDDWRSIQSPPLAEVIQSVQLTPAFASASSATLPAYTSTSDLPSY